MLMSKLPKVSKFHKSHLFAFKPFKAVWKFFIMFWNENFPTHQNRLKYYLLLECQMIGFHNWFLHCYINIVS